ncbi:MAG: FkbM family methyltransferase [Actinobacteria bacterium]|nr:FkbM family methyltransferase [Actinomycetota bacterium]
MDATASFAWAKERPAIQVPLRQLDTVLAEREMRRPTLLKLDVQGFEIEVIAGASTTVNAVDAVLVEVAFARTYEGQPFFDEIHARLIGDGWALDGPLEARREGNRIVELDCLYTMPHGRLPTARMLGAGVRY